MCSGAQNVFSLTSQNVYAQEFFVPRGASKAESLAEQFLVTNGNFGYVALTRNAHSSRLSLIALFHIGRLLRNAQDISIVSHPAPLWSIALSFNNNYLATSGADGTITRNLNYIIPSYYLAGQGVVSVTTNYARR